ncbi:Plasmid stabilization system protein [Sporotomaculum syntrophicum]|uniref:Plasmid stabilization system protein n=1 Tax=Sporotomaculum syntrophicum TaxID=182264 RepID=A0A9D2WRS3_9FIRM|nr:type II toxin-antitoxin system RelE/ParE family toxin [Sporotomaculum syntrophicum]KAF1086385.1 Plasmid stabilization system protein [Sporotomaculum syntrophicum]
MSYNVVIANSVQKVIKKMDKPTRERIIKRIKELQKSPWAGDVKPLKGLPGELRTRVGDWRIIYSIDSDQLIIIILKVSSRGDAYK